MKYAACLKWFTGKARERAEEAIKLLEQSETDGQWIPKASRSVRAALGKANVAIKLGREIERIREVSFDLKSYNGPGHDLDRIMVYGNLYRILDKDLDKSIADLRKIAVKRRSEGCSHVEEIDEAIAYVAAFRPAAEAMSELDATRPAPVFTAINVSPTITKTLQDASLDLDLKTIRYCPHKKVRVRVVDPKTGKGSYEWWIKLLWPKRTVFYASRFAGYSPRARFRQCEACGHAIKNPWNWVPLLIDNAKGIPHAVWVGRDCAGNVFGVKVTGEIKIEGETPANSKT